MGMQVFDQNLNHGQDTRARSLTHHWCLGFVEVVEKSKRRCDAHVSTTGTAGGAGGGAAHVSERSAHEGRLGYTSIVSVKDPFFHIIQTLQIEPMAL